MKMSFLGHFGSYLGHFGPFWFIFGPFRGIFGKICGKFKFFCGIVGVKILAFRMYAHAVILSCIDWWKSYHQWPARWAHLFTLVTRSPSHAKPTRWEMWKLAMRALTIILAQELGFCMFKPPYQSRPYHYKFGNSTQIEVGRIRLTSQSNHNHIL